MNAYMKLAVGMCRCPTLRAATMTRERPCKALTTSLQTVHAEGQQKEMPEALLMPGLEL